MEFSIFFLKNFLAHFLLICYFKNVILKIILKIYLREVEREVFYLNFIPQMTAKFVAKLSSSAFPVASAGKWTESRAPGPELVPQTVMNH